MKIKLNEIKIKDDFLNSKPKKEKLKKHLQHYIKNDDFMKPILLDKDNILLDGYITYLIAKIFNYEEIEVMTVQEIWKDIETVLRVTTKSIGESFIEIGKMLFNIYEKGEKEQ